MYRNYQQRRADEEVSQRPRKPQLATVDSVSSDGITVIFDGEDQPTQKKLKYNRSVTFSKGQRVKVCWVGGSCIVEYPLSS